MEHVSVLADEDVTDRPGCTHPWLAGLGRWVHDRVGEPVRDDLRRAAPDLVGVLGPDEAIRHALVVRCARLGWELTPANELFRRLAEGDDGESGSRWFRTSAPRRLVDFGALFVDVCVATAVLEPAARDEVLGALLLDALAECRALGGHVTEAVTDLEGNGHVLVLDA